MFGTCVSKFAHRIPEYVSIIFVCFPDQRRFVKPAPCKPTTISALLNSLISSSKLKSVNLRVLKQLTSALPHLNPNPPPFFTKKSSYSNVYQDALKKVFDSSNLNSTLTNREQT